MARNLFFFLIFNVLSQALLAQEQRRWSLSLNGGYQYASPRQCLGRFTDALLGSPSSGPAFGLDLAYFWNRHWGVFAAMRLSGTRREWPGDFQQALEGNYPDEWVRVAFARGASGGSVSQGLLGVRRRVFFQKMALLPSLSVGFVEVPVSDGGADLKTPGSHALRNVFAYSTEEDSWLMSLALEAGVRAEWRLWRRLRLSTAAHYTWTKPDAEFDFYEVDQVGYTLRNERLRYARAQHLLGLSAGLSWAFGRPRS